MSKVNWMVHKALYIVVYLYKFEKDFTSSNYDCTVAIG